MTDVNMHVIPFEHGLSELRSVDDEKKSWFEPGDPFNNRLELLFGRFGDGAAATVFYAGLPMMTVTTDGDVPSEPTVLAYEWSMMRFTQNDAEQLRAMFLQVIDVLPVDGYTDTFGNEFEDPVVRVAEGEDLDEIISDYETQGYELLAFVGWIEEAMQKEDPDLPKSS